MYLKYCRIFFGTWIYPYCCFSWALSIFFPHRLHVACSFVISSWDSVCSSAISKKLVGSSEISERQSIYPPPTSCFLPWWSCMDFLLSLTIEEFLLTLSSNDINFVEILSSSDERVFTISGITPSIYSLHCDWINSHHHPRFTSLTVSHWGEKFSQIDATALL